MRVRFNSVADTLYVRFDDAPITESEEIRPGFILDFAEQGEIVGLEVLLVGEQLTSANLEHLDFEVL